MPQPGPLTPLEQFTLQWFQAHPGRAYTAEFLRAELSTAYRAATGQPFGDPGRTCRELVDRGRLQRPSRGMYSYDPSADSRSGG